MTRSEESPGNNCGARHHQGGNGAIVANDTASRWIPDGSVMESWRDGGDWDDRSGAKGVPWAFPDLNSGGGGGGGDGSGGGGEGGEGPAVGASAAAGTPAVD